LLFGAIFLIAWPKLAGAADPAEGGENNRWQPPFMEVLIEGGMSLPRGYLVADWGTQRGSNARAGYDIGFRARMFVAPRIALSPSIHFTQFKSFSGVEELSGPLEVTAGVLHAGLDMQYFPRARQGSFQPYVTLGLGLARNRYQEDRGEEEPPTETVNAFDFSLGGGVRFGSLEFSLTYRVNRFETSRFVDKSSSRQYRWDYAVIALGWHFPEVTAD
jgi:hypothetical protein